MSNSSSYGCGINKCLKAACKKGNSNWFYDQISCLVDMLCVTTEVSGGSVKIPL